MNTTFKEIQEQIASKTITCVNLVTNYLKRIDEKKDLNIFIEVFDQEALEQAQIIDEKIANGTAGRLAGMVIALKDNICYKNHKVSAASKMLENFESLFSATVVERLLKEDAIIIGRVNCDEFAMGSSTEKSYYKPTLNPVNKEYVPGGSSGGSAAAVAANLCTVALGSDTGGSIRQPSSFCGTVGLKPTYGRVSRWGLIAFASSFDQIGPIANAIEDCALVLEVMAGQDALDTTSDAHEVPSYIEGLSSSTSSTYKVAYFKECLEADGLDECIKTAFLNKIIQLKQLGWEIEELQFPLLKYLIPTYYVLTTAEASSNLSRYDGVHFGYRSSKATDLETVYTYSRSEAFGKEVQRRIMLGTFVLSSGYYDAYYAKAQKVRRLIVDATRSIFETYDAVLLPTTPDVAFKLGEKSSNPLTMYLEDIFTVHANLAGIPAISLPLGVNEEQMPFGIQVMTNHFQEELLFKIAKQVL